jgi:hypothetical protein
LTYAAGFYTDHGIYLTADSASTGGPDSALHSDTFFGEPAIRDSYAVSDNSMKIFQLSDSRLVAAAGDAENIHRCVQHLRDSSDQFSRPDDLFANLQASMRHPLGSVTFVIAQLADTEFEMGIWRSGDTYVKATPMNESSASAICTGSGLEFSYLTEGVAKSIRSVTEKTARNNAAFISCCHQLHGVHADHVSMNIGGAFVTAVLTRRGIIWQPDITYFKYSPSVMRGTKPGAAMLMMFYPINVLVREGVVFVERRVPEYRRIYMSNGVSAQQRDNILSQFDKEVSDTARLLSCEYGAFLSSDEPCAVLIHHFLDDYCYKNTIEDGIARITFSEDIYCKLLEEPKIARKRGAMNVFCAPINFLSPGYETPQLHPSNRDL